VVIEDKVQQVDFKEVQKGRPDAAAVV